MSLYRAQIITKIACIFNKFKIIMLFIIKYGNDTWLKA